MTAGVADKDKKKQDHSGAKGKSLRERRLRSRKQSLEELKLPTALIHDQQILHVQQEQQRRRSLRRQPRVRHNGQHALGQHALGQHALGQHVLGQLALGQHVLGQHAHAAPQSAPPPAAHQRHQLSVPGPRSAGGDSPNAEAYTVKRFLVIKYECDDNGVLPPPLSSATVEAVAAHGLCRDKTEKAMEPPPAVEHTVEHPVTKPEHPVGHAPVDGHAAKPLRRGSVHPSVLPASSSFPEDDNANKCCCTILCEKWSRCMSASIRRILANPLCPSSTWITRFLSMVIIGFLFLAAAILLVGGNGWSQIVTAVVLAWIVGILVNKATSLPPLLGMLLVGVLMRQLGYIEYFSVQHEAIIYISRSWALVVLMVRTGFHLDNSGMHGLSPLMVVLAILPGLVEFMCVTLMAVFVLGMPASFAVMSGIIMAAACPSILGPCFSMMGAGRAVQAVLMSVACLNDLIVIVGFGVAVAITFSFSGDTLPYVFLHRLMGVGCGVLLGVVSGLFLRVVPEQNDPQVTSLRSVLLSSVGLFSMLGFARIGFFGGGPAACIVAAWMASRGWRKQGWGPDYRGNPVATVFDVMWRIMQPVMFCLMGADVELHNYDTHNLVLTVVVLLATWLVRIIVSMAVTAYTDLSIKERLYVTLAWVPKAGVQAALCPLALDQARYRGDKGDIVDHSRDVMLFVLLAVVLTAPLSAALTSRRGLANVLLPESGRRTSTVSRTGIASAGISPPPTPAAHQQA